MPHRHEDFIRRGLVFEYCTDCGAVRTIPQIAKERNRPQDAEWHVCDLCRLPGATV